jgi:hypothetical protein
LSETVSGEGVWKNIAVFLAGLVLAGAGWLATTSHESISRAEVDEKVREVYQRTDQQFQSVNQHLENIDKTQVESVKELARIGEHLGVKPTTH